MPFDPMLLGFACFWSSDELRRDLDILMRAGRIQEEARADGDDTPGRWFYMAAGTYAECDDLGRLARRTCALVSAHFFFARPS